MNAAPGCLSPREHHELVALAAHELGHAIVAEALGFEVLHVEIREDGGEALHQPRADADSTELVAVSLAGGLAEARATGCLFGLHLSAGDRQEIIRPLRLPLDATDSEILAHDDFGPALALAGDLLAAHWAALLDRTDDLLQAAAATGLPYRLTFHNSTRTAHHGNRKASRNPEPIHLSARVLDYVRTRTPSLRP